MEKRSIHVLLYGGLGNQLFQVGSALVCAAARPDDVLKLDFSLQAKYETAHENLLLQILNLEKYEDVQVVTNSVASCVRVGRLFPVINRHLSLISDKNFKRAIESQKKIRRYIFDGYFQNWITNKTFPAILSMLKEHQKDNVVNLDKVNDQVALHIRGGDFLNHPHRHTCNIEYYKRAIQWVRENVSKSPLLIFTDDQHYARHVMKKTRCNDYSFFKGHGAKDDFFNFGASKFQVLSNSTFCLWSSALSSVENNVVIGPSEFYPGFRRNFHLPNEIVDWGAQ